MKKKLLAYLLVAVILVPLCCPRSASAAAVPSLRQEHRGTIDSRYSVNVR